MVTITPRALFSLERFEYRVFLLNRLLCQDWRASISFYLLEARGRISGFVLFPWVLMLQEMQTASDRIWTQVARYRKMVTITPRTLFSLNRMRCIHVHVRNVLLRHGFIKRTPYVISLARGAVENILNWEIVIIFFELMVCFYVHIQSNTLWKCLNPFTHPPFVKYTIYYSLALNKQRRLICL